MERLQTIDELRQALTELRELGNVLKNTLPEVLNLIERDGFATSSNQVAWTKNFVAWIKQLSFCESLYARLFFDPIPESLVAVEKVLDAEEKRVREENFFGQAGKFLDFVTDNAELKKILREHKNHLKKLLMRKRQNEKLKAELEPYAKFISAAEETDFAKKFSAGKELSEYFGDVFIGRGLFGGALKISTIAADNPPVQTQHVEPQPQPVKGRRGRRKSVAPTLPLEFTKPELPKPDVSDFARFIISRGALLNDDDFDRWEKIFNLEKNERGKEFSASRFKRDFKNPEILKPVLRYVAARGMLRAPEFYPKKMPPNIVDNIAQLLLNRGYFRRYTFDSLGSFYGLTTEFANFIKTENGKKFITNSKHGEKFDFDNPPFLTDDFKVALTRMIFFSIHQIVMEHNRLFDGVEFFAQSFKAEFIGPIYYDLFIGCFWDTADECDKFLKRLAGRLNKNKDFNHVFVVGLTLEQTAKIFDALKKVLANDLPADADFYLYSFNDAAFYFADTKKPVSVDEIWKTPPPEPEDDTEKNSDDEDDAPPIQKSEPLSLDADVKEKILHDVKDLLADEKFYCATAYLKAQSLNRTEVEPLYRQLAFALDDPLLNEGYSADAVSILAMQDDTAFNEALITAAALRALFYNDFGVDYGVPALNALIGSYDLVRNNAPLSELIADLKTFKTEVRKGIDFYADYRTKDKAVAEENLAKVIRAAEDYHVRFFEGHQTDKAYNETFIRMKQNLFSRNGDLAQIFRAIKDRAEVTSGDMLDLVKDYLAENFLKANSEINAVNLDADKLNQFISERWDEACDKKNPGKLTGELKNNITKTLERAVEIMCAWVNCAEIFSSSGEDSGSVEYKKIRSQLLAEIKAARKRFKDADEIGVRVVDKTLVELSARLEGSFNPLNRKYFYVQFLCADKVILDENYLPKLDLNISDGTHDAIPEQIQKHAALKLPTIKERIEQIFEAGGDDFGSAQLLDDYLKETDGESFIDANYDLKKCISSAAKDAPGRKESFIGGLELAQSYGQFDLLPEGEKEKILQLAENCYEYAAQSQNFGVFFRVKKYWEDVLAKSSAEYAKVLKGDLQTAIDAYKKVVQNFDAAELKNTVAEIEQIIASKNFTVARSLIFRLSEGELYKKFDAAEDTALSRFISDYGDCYNKVYDNAYSLDTLLAKKIFPHDKVSRAKLNLVKSWITNPVGEDRIKTLLELLGFDVESVQKIFAPSNAMTFNVTTLITAQTKYYHPIAAFGSDAEVSGFRVMCLFGRYDEKNLIGKFKELGNGKHTLIFLDWALDLPTRRRLAKEIKIDKSLTKVFAVVDRVAIMYLLKNCAEQLGTKRITDSLMSIIMPFARYQPYISSPKIPLPPEMFIGRESEINEVTNQSGVNIVCGGRQLGKSALLKMACRKIDGHDDERAIYLDILDKDYRQAARLTSQELSDKNFFTEPFETDDWEDLTRAIKNRLASDELPKIPYFLLMLDEADGFIESCADTNYAPIVALAKIQQDNHNGSRFKFVIAGLRNIIRFEREQILSNNNILPTLKSLTIKPFGLEDARKLLEVPLRYLGLYFPDNNKDSLILTILESANYFPSLIQLYCEKLVKALFETSYAGYNADTPIYTISEDHIKKVLADKEFTKDIKTKIEITLGLGRDKYYHAIANLLAYLYYNVNNVDGYSPRDILNAAGEFSLVEKETLPASEDKIGALMEELCELNILRKTNAGKYLFSRQRILRVVGSRSEVDDALLKLATEAEHG